jgi:NADH-quinone oxidoreductase subunit N
MGLAVVSDSGYRGLLIYMAIYIVMTIGAFAVIVAMRRNGRPVELIADLAGLGRTDPAMALWMAVFMFSLAGIPPLAGFFGKLYIFLAAVQGGYWVLALIGISTSVVASYYYIHVVKVMYFDALQEALDLRPTSLTVVMVGTGLAVLLFALFPAALVSAAQVAVSALAG